MNSTDFFCGLLAGWAQVIFGQPFDFVKVRIQTEKEIISSLEIAKQIKKTFGIKGFYRGSSSLFFGFSGTIGTEFLVYEWAKRQLYSRLGNRPLEYNPAKLRLWEVGVAGGIVGWAVSFIYCPVEYTKIQCQLSTSPNHSSFRLLFKQIFTNGIKNIYRGYWITALREIYGSICYYFTYEAVVRLYTKQHRQKADSLVFLTAGAISGISYHLLTYPIDTIKSNIQAGKNLKQSIADSLVLSKLRGYRVVLLRAMLVNAASFWTYEQAQKYIFAFNNYYYSMY